ncbi:ABC transporter permease [Paenibacillus sp. AR247]|uniref:ABC transporter permease n=1 Tax=Paenibacillus sp. AR247 TaxID=1631599 RepID=UPI000CF8B231|nr:ABC transporter permease [Paenibacillus sp. AR247]PQP88975.1 ABC transporter permease [Paenibacillus sp. AR247]
MSHEISAAGPSLRAGFGRWKLLGLGLILPGAVLVLWQIFGQLGYISDLLFPTPLVILKAFVGLAQSGDLWDHFRISAVRALAGFARRGERWDIGEESKILLIAKGAFFPIYINTYLGIRNVDNKWFEVTRVLGYSRIQQIRRLVIPAALPNILLGTRLSIGLSWLGLVVAELIASTSGVGYMMSDARQFADTPVVFVGIIVFAAAGLITDYIVRLAERRLLRWKESYNR